MYCVLSISDSINSQISSQIDIWMYHHPRVGQNRGRWEPQIPNGGDHVHYNVQAFFGHFKLLPSASIFNIPPFSTIYALKDKWSSLHQNPFPGAHKNTDGCLSPSRWYHKFWTLPIMIWTPVVSGSSTSSPSKKKSRPNTLDFFILFFNVFSTLSAMKQRV